jgi:hypothetical protein
MSLASTTTTLELKCLAGTGMLPHEAAVLIEGRDQHYELMVDSELVDTQEGELTRELRPAALNVTLVKESGDDALIELPRQTVTAGRRIWVSKSQLGLL